MQNAQCSIENAWWTADIDIMDESLTSHSMLPDAYFLDKTSNKTIFRCRNKLVSLFVAIAK
jgi:hypothetical protein